MLLLSPFVVVLETETIYLTKINDTKQLHVGLAVSPSPFYTPLSCTLNSYCII
jgi:hypothetical protein